MQFWKMYQQKHLLIAVVVVSLATFAAAQNQAVCFPTGGDNVSQLLNLINTWRANQGLSPVAPDSRLTTAAQLHSADWAANPTLFHAGSDGSTFFERMQRQGYPAPGSELLGAQYGTASALFDAWVADSAYRDVLTTPGYTNVGIDMVNFYWTADFGSDTNGTTCASSGTNWPPKLVVSESSIVISRGHTRIVVVSATDLNGDILTFGASGLPAWGTFVDNGNSSATLTLLPTANDAGIYEITVSASDGSLSDSKIISVQVLADRPPVLDGVVANWTVPAGTSSTLTLSAHDPDGDPLSFTASGLPSFVTLDASTGTLSANPSSSDMGTYDGIELRVSDGMLSDARTISITVTQLCSAGTETPAQELITLINGWRLTQGLSQLAPDPRLKKAADLHSADWAAHPTIGHLGSDGSDYTDRIMAQGYPDPAGELIGAGYSTATSLLNAWINDPSHRDILAMPGYTHVGVGMVTFYWTADFGHASDGPTCAASVNRAPIANAGTDQSGHLGTSFSLNGTASNDPDGNYPLAYSWTVKFAPPGSQAAVSNPFTATPSFTPDLLGTYTLRLVVTDSLNSESEPAIVNISTSNVAPVAEAGPDQAIVQIGTTVQLDGSASYDADGDNIVYSWSMQSEPVSSKAALSDPTSPKPSFVADVNGDYVVQLIVRDTWSMGSDTVTISFTNLPPVATAGVNQAALVGDTVLLDGRGSNDPNGDVLFYKWSLISKPTSSTATLSQAQTAQPTLVVDKPGIYVISLVVNDGLIDSSPNNVTVTATYSSDQAIFPLTAAINAINSLPPNVFKNPNMRNALTNQLSATIRAIDQGALADAMNKLTNDVRQKLDGCTAANAADKNDWLLTCASQDAVYPFVAQAIDVLKYLQ